MRETDGGAWSCFHLRRKVNQLGEMKVAEWNDAGRVRGRKDPRESEVCSRISNSGNNEGSSESVISIYQ
jgi:hypothetical protein